MEHKAVALVSAYAPTGMRRYIPLGPLCIASIIREAGFELHYIDYQDLRKVSGHRLHEPKVFSQHVLSDLEEREAGCPAVIAISCMLDLLPTVLLAAGTFRARYPEALIVLGGPGPSLNPKYILNICPEVDVIFHGEGEVSFAAWLEAYKRAGGSDLSHADLAGVAYREGDRVMMNPRPARERSLNGLPFPAYDLYAEEGGANVPIPLETARGCPFDCVFCDAKAIWGREVTGVSMGEVFKRVDRLRELCGRPEILSLRLPDDTFTLDRKRVVAFCEGMRGRGCAWTCFARLDLVDEELLVMMWEAGCRGIFFGADSGSDRMLPQINKQLDVATIMKATEVVRSCIPPECVTMSFIWGFPEETLGDFYDTLHLFAYMTSIGFDTRLYPLNVIPGSPVYAKHFNELKPLEGFSDGETRNAYGYTDLSALQDPEFRSFVLSHPRLFTNYFYFESPDHRDKALLTSRVMSLEVLVG